MDGDLFYKWFEVIFLKHCQVRPAVIILDNHESYLTLKLIKEGTDRALRSPSAHDTHNSTSYSLPLSTTQSKIFRTCNQPWLFQEEFNYWKGKVSALSNKKNDIIHQYSSKAKVFLKLHYDIYGSVYVFEKNNDSYKK